MSATAGTGPRSLPTAAQSERRQRIARTLTYSFQLKGVRTGAGNVSTVMSTPAVRGVTGDVDTITIR